MDRNLVNLFLELTVEKVIGRWINVFERQSSNRRNPSVLEPQLVRDVLTARDSPSINPLTYWAALRLVGRVFVCLLLELAS